MVRQVKKGIKIHTLSLRDKTISGISWSAAGNIVMQFFQFIVSIVLARLLTPEDFGLLGMAMVFVAFFRIFSNSGLSQAIIHKKNVSRELYDTVFILNIIIGIILSLILYFFAPIISKFYENERLNEVVKLFSILFFITSLSINHNALLRKNLKFKSIAFIGLLSSLLSSILAVSLAYYGFGVYSLVWQQISASVIRLILLWYYSPWKPAFSFKFSAIRDVWRYSTNLSLSSTLNFFTRNSDNLLIGKYLGSYDLGIYSKAYGLMLMPINQVTSVFSSVMFPVLSSIQDDVVRVKKIFLQSNRLIALLSMPMMVGLIATADNLIITLLGNKWAEVVPIIQILAIVGIKQPIGSTHGWIYLSQGRTDIQLYWNIISSVTAIISFFIGLPYGITGIAIAYTVRTYGVWYWGVSIPGKLINLNFLEYIENLVGIFSISCLMGLAVWSINFLMYEWEKPLALGIQILTGILMYWGCLHIFKVKAYQEAVGLLQEQINKRKTVIG